MLPVEIARKHEVLVAQCPPATRLSESEASELPIHVERSGTTGPRILIIHGGVQGNVGGGPATFAKQKKLASHGWQVEIVDRPGFGKSPSRGVDDMEAHAIWIAEMLGDGAHLVGHSWGGAEVLLAAARRPSAIHSLTMVEPALQGLEEVSAESQSTPDSEPSMALRMNDLLMEATSPADYISRFLNFLGATKTIGQISNEAASHMGCAMLQGRMAEPATLHEAVSTIAKARIPVLCISGGWNNAIDAVTQTVARLTGGQYAHVPSSSHFPQMENAAQFNSVLEAFLQGK
jgi:pimeloyl-ACP methyl ester carboxylesterase